jgi:virulence factor
MMRIGAIGIDTSHLPEFTRRIREMHDAGTTACLVTRSFDAGDHGWPVGEDVDNWRRATEELGVTAASSMDELLDDVDGVMVLAIDGHRHLELARPALERGLPTYIDKPLTCSSGEATGILRLARASGAPCYSASSLRFATELERIDLGELGDLVAIDAFGPGELNPSMEGLFHYGVHTLEMVDAIWGPGVARVRAIEDEQRHLVDLEYGDGRHAHLRLERAGAYDFGATIHGEKGVTQFCVDFGPVYTRLVQAMTQFFSGGGAPVELLDIVKTVAVMEAGNASCREGGRWLDVPAIE